MPLDSLAPRHQPATPIIKPYSATIHVVNLMGESAFLGGCTAGAASALTAQPRFAELQSTTTDGAFINTTHLLEAIEGYCWWSIKGNSSACGEGNGTYPAPEVTSCPWVGWKRGVVSNHSSIGLSVEWDVEGPHEVAQNKWTDGSRAHHRFCFCDAGVSRLGCEAVCEHPPTMPPAPSPGPPPATHYSNPHHGGCRMDEKPMTVSSDAATGRPVLKICSAPCVRKGLFKEVCPADQPAGSTAHASCNFIDGDETDEQYCALICDTDADCGAGAVCHIDHFPPTNATADDDGTSIGFCGYNSSSSSSSSSSSR